MNLVLRDHRSIHIFIGCLIIALIPSILFWYLAFVILAVKIFFIACIIDFITRSSIRKNMSPYLVPALLACITAFIISYLFFE